MLRFSQLIVRASLLLLMSIMVALHAIQLRSEPADADKPSMPDESRLRLRLAQHAKAAGERDARHLYEMLSPHIRTLMSFEDYCRDSGLDDDWERQSRVAMRIALERACSCDEWTYADGSETFRCVLLVDTASEAPGEQLRSSRSLQMWEYTRGEWYFGLDASGDRCPSRAPTPAARAAPLEHITAPELSRLEQRLDTYYRAILSRDARGMYETQTPATRSQISLQEYEEGIPVLPGSAGTVSLSAVLSDVCSCQRFNRPYPRTRCNVLVHLDQESAAGDLHRATRIDLWEHADGEWFYVASGIGERCPGDSVRDRQ